MDLLIRRPWSPHWMAGPSFRRADEPPPVLNVPKGPVFGSHPIGWDRPIGKQTVFEQGRRLPELGRLHNALFHLPPAQALVFLPPGEGEDTVG